MYDEAAAKAVYLEYLADVAATQDLAEDRRPETRNLSIVFTVLAALFVTLRFVLRRRPTAYVGADDWLILLALFLLFGNMVMNLERKTSDSSRPLLLGKVPTNAHQSSDKALDCTQVPSPWLSSSN